MDNALDPDKEINTIYNFYLRAYKAHVLMDLLQMFPRLLDSSPQLVIEPNGSDPQTWMFWLMSDVQILSSDSVLTTSENSSGNQGLVGHFATRSMPSC